MVSFLKTEDSLSWLRLQPVKIQVQIDGRLLRIQEQSHYGHTRRLSSVLFKIKFNNRNHIYCTEININGKTLVLILGGNKNGQNKDIKKAQKIAEEIHGD